MRAGVIRWADGTVAIGYGRSSLVGRRVVTLLLVPWSIRIAHRFDIMAVPDARRLHPTPDPADRRRGDVLAAWSRRCVAAG